MCMSDLVPNTNPSVQAAMWARYRGYPTQLRGPECREQVFAYVEQQDRPRPLPVQLDLLREVEFRKVGGSTRTAALPHSEPRSNRYESCKTARPSFPAARRSQTRL
jgi:hypothetical protein